MAAGLEPGREDQVDAGLVDGARLGQRGRGADRHDLSSPALGQDRGGRDAEDEAEDRRPCLEQGLDLLVETRVVACRRLGPAEAQLAEPGFEHRPGALELSRARLPAAGVVVGDPEVQGERSGGAAAELGRERPDLVRLQDMGAIGAEAAQVRDGCGQLGRREPTAERPLDDRVADPQAAGGIGACAHRAVPGNGEEPGIARRALPLNT